MATDPSWMPASYQGVDPLLLDRFTNGVGALLALFPFKEFTLEHTFTIEGFPLNFTLFLTVEGDETDYTLYYGDVMYDEDVDNPNLFHEYSVQGIDDLFQLIDTSRTVRRMEA